MTGPSWRTRRIAALGPGRPEISDESFRIVQKLFRCALRRFSAKWYQDGLAIEVILDATKGRRNDVSLVEHLQKLVGPRRAVLTGV